MSSRPAWILVSQNIFEEDSAAANSITWIPTIENMLEVAFLMIAMHVKKMMGP